MSDVELPAEPPMEPEGSEGPALASDGETATSGRGRGVVLALLAVAAVLLAAVFVLASDDDDDGGAELGALPTGPTLPDAVEGQLFETGQEVVDLLAAGETGRYHATYRVEGDTDDTGEVTLEIWRDGDRAREDTHTVTDDATADTVSIVTADEAVLCSRLDDAEFACVAADPPTGAAADVAGSIRDQLVGVDVTERSEEIDGRAARCFTFATPDGEGELCASTDGVVLRLGVGDTVMRLVELDDDVPGDVFTPPADVTA